MENHPDVEEVEPALNDEQKKAVGEFSSQLKAVLAESTDGVPEVLYHYTDAEGLRSILTNGDIWATHHEYLNDPTEGTAGGQIIREVLEESSVGIAKGALRMMGQPGDGGESTYISSFSERGARGDEDLPQWLAYGDQGAGFAIGFDLRCMKDLSLRKVLYGEDNFKEAVQRVVVAAADTWSRISSEFGLQDDSIAESHAGWVLFGITDWACRMKSDAWAHEKEWRLVDNRWVFELTEGLKVRVRGSQLVPYRALKLWQDKRKVPITEIVLGPLQHERLGAKAVAALWHSLELETVDKSRHPESPTPKIWESRLNYRNVR